MSEIDQQKKIQQAKDELKKVNDLLSELEKIGVDAPLLRRSVVKLTKAIETGVLIAEASFEASKALEEATRELIKQCREDIACEVQIDRSYLNRNAGYVLNWNNKHSVIRNSVRKLICEKTPFDLAKDLRMCSDK